LIADRVAEAMGLSAGGGTAPEIAWAIRRFLKALTRRHPLVVLIDDIQWAEPTLLDLVEGLPGGVRDAPMLVLCLARPELAELRPD